ncbi:MAG: DUF4398 domain-containing protein [candidate division Zixibacteria bacterium]|nr:DUF4398 domain-containing protein [candidate division Zixibacteria bacterium]
MSKYKLFGMSLLLILGIILLSSCAKPPDKEMQAARDAVSAAMNAEANMYVPDLFTSAQDSLNQAEAFVSEKKYGDAKRLALFAKSWADSAAAMAETKKEEMKASAENAIKEATAKVDSMKKMKVPAKMKKEMDKMMKMCEDTLSEAKKALEAGNYKQVLDKANETINNANKAEASMAKKTAGTKKK